MNAHSVILAATAGVVAFGIVEAIHVGIVANEVKARGVTIIIPGLGRVPLKPGPGGASPVELPASAQSALDSMNVRAAIAALAVVGLVLVLAPR